MFQSPSTSPPWPRIAHDKNEDVLSVVADRIPGTEYLHTDRSASLQRQRTVTDTIDDRSPETNIHLGVGPSPVDIGHRFGSASRSCVRRRTVMELTRRESTALQTSCR